ncbi:MAG: DUF433 domain-containing protein [Phycisphaeraceae bacterium]
MKHLNRITFDPQVMGGQPCIRGLRVTVGMIVGLVAARRTTEEILAAYPYLEDDDIREALEYAAWRLQEREIPLGQS